MRSFLACEGMTVHSREVNGNGLDDVAVGLMLPIHGLGSGNCASVVDLGACSA